MSSAITVRPIEAAEVTDVADFLHRNLNDRLTPRTWAAAMEPSWTPTGAGCGMGLYDGEVLVGAYLAFTSRRLLGGTERSVTNLAAWCVLEAYRSHGLRLLRSLLRGADVVTDLSPSGSVVEIDERLGFTHLDTTSSLRPNMPGPTRTARCRVVTDPDGIADLIEGLDAVRYEDHRRALAARHLVLLVDGRPCYVMYRKVARKRLPLFAAVLHVGDTALLRRGLGVLGAHLLREGMPFLLAEHRHVGGPLPGAVTVAGRPKLFRGEIAPDLVDDLYSELTCVPW